MFRLDRFLTLNFFYPLLKRRPPASEPRIPILMYHSISDDPEDGVHPYYRLNTSPKRFAEHLKLLADNQYQVISLSDAVRMLNHSVNQSPNQPKTHATQSANQPLNHVVLTFDDGLLDFFTAAFPILEEYNCAATVFLPAGLMGDRLAGHAVMSWAHARKLAEKGVVLGSHSMTHPKLSEVGTSELEQEIRGSKIKIESELGREIDAFSYPYAFPEQNRSFVQFLKKLLSGCGYNYGVTTSIGRSSRSDARIFLKRLPVNGYDDSQLLKAKIEGGYDWMHAAQKLFKKVKSIVPYSGSLR
jgi:peptidoglycan/xylan/chitin deacetylase (PgdA/CDA1 family)